MALAKLLLTITLSTLVLVSARAVAMPWTLTNFDYLQQADESQQPSESRPISGVQIPSFNLSLSDLSTSGDMQLASQTVVLETILIAMRSAGPDKFVPKRLILAQKDDTRIAAATATPTSQTVTVYTSPTTTTTCNVWAYTFSGTLPTISTSIDYDLIFATSDWAIYETSKFRDDQTILARNIADEPNIENAIWAPFILISGTYTPSSGGVPEPTALSLLALGVALTFLRRR